MLAALQKLWRKVFKPPEDLVAFPEVFEHFQELLQDHQKVMEIIADLGEKSGGDFIFDRKYLQDSVNELHVLLLQLIKGLNLISSNRYLDLYATLDRIFVPLEAELRGRLSLAAEMPLTVALKELPVDHPELSGGKAANLGEISQRLHLPVPDGFVITTRAYRTFLEQNRLESRTHALISAWLADETDTLHTSRQLQYGILAGVVPQEVAREIRRFTENVPFWAVRSSAYGEDGELSFAGLHESLLQVPARGVADAYKKVLASLFSPEALAYRRRMDMLGEEAAMGVLCQEVITSQASGVVHSLTLECPETDCLTIYAYPGLGRPVMDGRARPDRFIVARQAPHQVKSREVFPKEYIVRPAPGGGEEEVAPPPEDRDRAAIGFETIQTLAHWAMSLERYFKRPQEIEWAEGPAGQIWVLQSRPLAFSQIPDIPKVEVTRLHAQYPVLLQDQGVVAHAGVGSGKVFLVQSDADLGRFPDGAVLVTRYTAPWLARVVPQAAAIVSERGSPAGHLATIAREFRVPTLVGVEGATEVLKPGMEVTVDTNDRLVFAGRVQELLRYELMESTAFEDAAEFRLLRRILKRIGPLTLVDPQDPGFTPEGCRSVHDVIRFVHEKAVQELMDLPRFLKRFKGAQLWTLVSDIPIGLKIWDLGGGIGPEARGNEVTAAEITSQPLKTLWEGVCAPGVWSTEPIQVDFSGLMSSLTRTTEAATAAGFNLAVITGTYLNLHLRLGYHFNLVDARMDPDPHHNHIYFRFVGGVTDLTRRSRRAKLLADILSKYHFKVDTKGDLVIARILHLPQEDIRQRLLVLGRLIGFTRQLDMQLKSDEDVPVFTEKFLEGIQSQGDKEAP